MKAVILASGERKRLEPLTNRGPKPMLPVANRPVLTDGANASETLRNVKEVESRGAPVVGASSLENAESFVEASFTVPELGDLEPLVANVYLQLFAHHVADELRRNIDTPRDLAKSVTVE